MAPLPTLLRLPSLSWKLKDTEQELKEEEEVSHAMCNTDIKAAGHAQVTVIS